MTVHNILVVFGVYATRKFIFWSDAFISHFIFADLDFEPLVSENARLWGHISHGSNMHYLKTVVEHFDERQREDFGNSCLRFDIQEYALVTGLRCGLFLDDNVMERVLDKRRLKDKYFKHVDKISCAQLKQTFLRSSTPRANRYKLGLALINQ
ncbi:Hypothetical predicted protein [Olea europaea subsp. europaea]|uniref:DUF1985 domain-containing protein n=1 Tax=Olea europaea subsp. europaea TaxID=158383 RepID=A0A8S0RIY7_OLEEU|nr:Hypothetical predicted protein [Olea europaea subsp. europaea]